MSLRPPIGVIGVGRKPIDVCKRLNGWIEPPCSGGTQKGLDLQLRMLAGVCTQATPQS